MIDVAVSGVGYGVVYGVQALVVSLGGLFTSWTDARFGTIRNPHVLALGLAGGILTGVDALLNSQLLPWVLSAVLCIALPLLLWIKGWIPAGDAKLLMAMGIAVPFWWYPTIAPALFPFSLIILVAFGALSIPIIAKAVKDGPVPLVLPSESPSESLSRPGNVSPGLMNQLVVSIFMSWIFLIAWQAWMVVMHVSPGPAVKWGGAVALMLGYGAVLGWAGMRLPSGIAGGGAAVMGWLFVYWGGNWIWLVLSVVGAGLMLWFNDVILRRIEVQSKRRVSHSDVSKGDVIAGANNPDGLSQDAVVTLKSTSGNVWVREEVRFAKAVFGSVMLIGAIRLAEWFMAANMLVRWW